MKLRQCLSFLLVCVLSSAACQKEPGAPPGLPEKITIAYPQTSYSIPFRVGLTKGFFAAEGLEVTDQAHEFGKMALKSVLDGKADLAISGDTPVMFAIVAGNRISVIAAIATAKKNEVIVARKDRGIETPPDLKGRRIGVPFGTTAHFFLESFLTAQGIHTNEVDLIGMGPGEMAEALTEGKVDAVAAWSPASMQLKQLMDDRGVVFQDEGIHSDTTCVSALQEFVKNHPERINKLLKAFIKAVAYMKKEPDESRRLASEFLRMDRAAVDDIWSVMDFQVALDQSLLVRLEYQGRWALKNNLVHRITAPNYLDYIYFDGLQAVAPDAVRIIR